MESVSTISEKLVKLNSLAQDSNDLYDQWGRDSVASMELNRKMAWAQLLSSIASSEATEELLIRPLADFFKDKDREVYEYIVQHACDEEIHAQIFEKYVKKTFLYSRKDRSLTDKLIYDRLFKKVSAFSKNRPIPLMLAILFYEMCSDYFYKHLLKVAKKDKLNNLAHIIAQIDQDENRHRAGIKFVFKYYVNEIRPMDRIDKLATYFLLRVIWLDVNTGSYAFYNKEVVENFKTLGLDSGEFYDFVNKSYKKIVTDIKSGSLH